MNNIFFSSDYHFFHKNILLHHSDTRKGETVEEMNEHIIQAHNNTVTRRDTIYMLGDISFGNADATEGVLRRLNGNKILVYGNHDQIIRKKPDLQKYFNHCVDYKEIRIDGKKICMMHFPIEQWNSRGNGAIHLHGHSHGNLSHDTKTLCNRMDIGIDTRYDGDMKPWEFGECVEHMRIRDSDKEINYE